MRFTFAASLALILTVAASSMNAGQSASGQSPITFTKDVAPIFQNNCQVCHRPGSIAPMSLLTYEEARPWARSIKQKVLAREMPPWFIDKNIGIQRFKDDISLSDEEIAKIAKWVDSGAPQGNPADMPPPRQYPDARGWTIAGSDRVVAGDDGQAVRGRLARGGRARVDRDDRGSLHRGDRDQGGPAG